MGRVWEMTEYEPHGSRQKRNAHLPEESKQDVSVERSLVCLIHDHCRVMVQVWLPQRLSQENTIRHVLDKRGL